MGYLLHVPLVWDHAHLGDFCKVTERRMEAYYYSFDSTGCDPVDKILGAVACAGKAYHHTDDWYEHASPRDDHTGGTPIDWIQNAAVEAAEEFKRLRAELTEWREEPFGGLMRAGVLFSSPERVEAAKAQARRESADEIERLRSERDAARGAAVRADIVCDQQHDEIQQLRTALREARQGLEYWGPITGHGFGEKERIMAILDAALGLSTSD